MGESAGCKGLGRGERERVKVTRGGVLVRLLVRRCLTGSLTRPRNWANSSSESSSGLSLWDGEDDDPAA